MGDDSIVTRQPVGPEPAATAIRSGFPGPKRTEPPGKYVLLYDGSCRFCTAQSRNLLALARRGTVDAVDFQQPGVLARFPGISQEACMQAMHLVTPDGRIFRGFEAAVRTVATRPVLGWIGYAYYLPGFRQFIDRLYLFIAARRYRLFPANRPECQTGTCQFHQR